ncbi:unnamed protein product, partial [Tenebrio molitor]
KRRLLADLRAVVVYGFASTTQQFTADETSTPNLDRPVYQLKKINLLAHCFPAENSPILYFFYYDNSSFFLVL